MLPYGSGKYLGSRGHETHDRFVWNGEQGAGDIGRYQIRHLTREDIALEKGFLEQFLGPADRIPLRKTRKQDFPAHDRRQRLSDLYASRRDFGQRRLGTSDPSYLGPVGNDYNLDKEGPTAGPIPAMSTETASSKTGCRCARARAPIPTAKATCRARISRPGPTNANGGTPKPTAAKPGCSTSRPKASNRRTLDAGSHTEPHNRRPRATSRWIGRSTATTTATTGTGSPNSRFPTS